MAKVNISGVRVVGENPSPMFSTPFQFEITLECFESLQDDLEFKLVYVGSAESKDNDQVLDSVLVGPMPEGRHRFVFEAPAPDPKKIPAQEAVGVTVVLLSCAYHDQEFVKIGYFVKCFYPDPELAENPPTEPQFDKMHREIVVDEPRVTKFIIKWDEDQGAAVDGGSSNGAGPSTNGHDVEMQSQEKTGENGYGHSG